MKWEEQDPNFTDHPIPPLQYFSDILLTGTQRRVTWLLLNRLPNTQRARGGQRAVTVPESSPHPNIFHIIEARSRAWRPWGPITPEYVRL